MSDDDHLPRLLSGRYRLEATLGHGGMGVVYRGVDLMMKRAIAVKLIRGVGGVELDDDVAGRFLREAKNTARLQHEHIVEVFDLGRTDEGGLYFVMELLEGESLSARLRREGALSPERTVHIGRQICEALAVAHHAGVVHRDLKPANIMLLSRAGDVDYVKVLDFGVAKSYSSDQETQLTHTGMLVGTIDYMAPEQITGKPVDGRTDVYALGVVLYKMLSGKPPFKDTGVPALIHAHLNTMPKPLMDIAPSVPNELGLVVLRCLSKSPDRRYESMGELSRALRAAILPEGADLLELEYGAPAPSDDPYALDDQTVMGKGLARRSSTSPRPAAGAPVDLAAPVPSDDATVNDGGRTFEESEEGLVFDDATLKMDRPLDFKKRSSASGGPLPMTPRGLRSPSTPPNPLAPPEDAGASPTWGDAKLPPPARFFGEEIPTATDEAKYRQREPIVCGMCRTLNPAHARQCVACGVALTEGDAMPVRARAVTGPPPPPRTASTPAPPLPPTPSPSDPFAIPHLAPTYPSHPPHTPNAPWPRTNEPQSMWERFLSWTGLRNR